MPKQPVCQEILPDTECKPPLENLEAVASNPLTCHLRVARLATTPFQVVAESDEVSPSAFFSADETTPVPQPLLIGLVF